MIRRCLAALLLVLAPPATAQQSGPRLLHVPAATRVSEQGVLTPVPIRLEAPTDLPARRVLLHYHVFGAAEWRTLELRREGPRYVGAIPCLEVSEMTREIRYYIRLHDAAGAVVAYSGTRSSPYRVAIHHPSARPDLDAGSARCPDPAECPPGLPGCPSQEIERVPCNRDADCEGGLTCSWEGYCVEEERRKNWLGIDVSQSVGFVSTQGACSVESQERAGFACFRETDGAIYTGRPVYGSEPVRVGRGPSRVLLSYERLLFFNTSLAARVGYGFAGEGPTLPQAPGPVPLSAELSARYWTGTDPFARRGLRPFVQLSVGAAQHDVALTVHVREDPLAPYSQGGNDLEQELAAWKRAGDLYLAVGGGAMLPLGDTWALQAELSLAQAFPFAATIASGSMGMRLGLP